MTPLRMDTWAIATLRDALGASPEVLAGLDGGARRLVVLPPSRIHPA